ncbi:hypothetical protein AWENTII_001853 [Aspergillus wentii]
MASKIGNISSLPPEVILMILSYLPLESLLSFGETSRSNYDCHLLSLKRLRLAVFQKRIHSIISFLQAGWATLDQVTKLRENGDCRLDFTASVVQPPATHMKQEPICEYPLRTKDLKRRSLAISENKPRTLEQMVRLQNQLFAKLVRRYGASLVDLEFMAYDINTESAEALGKTCKRSLRHLALRFEHPHIRDGLMRPTAWLQPARGSTAWNALIGIGPYKNMGITGLETLIMERTGITPWQLSMLVQNNPNLTTLKLRTCNGAQPEFLNWLGGYDEESDEHFVGEDGLAPGARLKVLWLENCQQVLSHPIKYFKNTPSEICDFDLEWVRGLKNLEVSIGLSSLYIKSR